MLTAFIKMAANSAVCVRAVDDLDGPNLLAIIVILYTSKRNVKRPTKLTLEGKTEVHCVEG